ncbi:MAG: LuxR C-terminal-related transcriptional regulator [Pseudonocardiaceae bacterium]
MISIVLGDDHAAFAESLAPVLTGQGFQIPEIARSLTGTIEAVRQHRPDLCLLGRRFPDGDGIAAVSHLIAVSPATRILILARSDTNAMRQAIRSGAAGYLLTTWGAHRLVHTLQRVIDGALALDAPRVNGARSGARSERSETRRLAAHLTTRERECLALLVEGLDTTAMTLRLGVSTTTVRSHVQGLLTKLGVHSRLEAATLAVRHDLVAKGRSYPVR